MTSNVFGECKGGAKKNLSTRGVLEKIVYESQKANEMYKTRITPYGKRSAYKNLAG